MRQILFYVDTDGKQRMHLCSRGLGLFGFLGPLSSSSSKNSAQEAGLSQHRSLTADGHHFHTQHRWKTSQGFFLFVGLKKGKVCISFSDVRWYIKEESILLFRNIGILTLGWDCWFWTRSGSKEQRHVFLF